MLKLVWTQLKLVLKGCSIRTSQHESLVTLDFVKEEKRSALIRLCFSVFAAWPLFIAFLIFYINPFRYQFTLIRFFGIENFLTQSLFELNYASVAMITGIFFIVNFLLQFEFLFLGLLGFLVSQGDMHIVLALICVAVVFAGRILDHFRWVKFLESFTKIVWIIFTFFSFLAWALAVHFSFQIYNYLVMNQYFSASMYANRFECFVLIVALYYTIELMILAIWGHFYSMKLAVKFVTYYSTAKILKKLSLSSTFKSQLKETVLKVQSEKVRYEPQDLDLLPKRIKDLHQHEESLLQKAISDLT